MNPVIPNDKYDIAGLKVCWEYVRTNITSVEITYFSRLAVKTYDLFSKYFARDDLPKTFVELICILAQYKTAGEYEEYSVPDIIKKVVERLLYTLASDYYCHNNEIQPFVVAYQNKYYTLDTKTFDITHITKKQN